MEGMLPQIMDGVPGVMEGVLRYLQDSHPRVRYAACNAIGQMSTDFAPVFEKKFHDRVVPGLLMLLEDNANPRVQAHAGTKLFIYVHSLILIKFIIYCGTQMLLLTRVNLNYYVLFLLLMPAQKTLFTNTISSSI